MNDAKVMVTKDNMKILRSSQALDVCQPIESIGFSRFVHKPLNPIYYLRFSLANKLVSEYSFKMFKCTAHISKVYISLDKTSIYLIYLVNQFYIATIL